MNFHLEEQQRKICEKFNCRPDIPLAGSKLGISKSAIGGTIAPIHGLRHPAEKGTNGWYIWAGEWEDREDFFLPLHVDHIQSLLPAIEQYLALPAGWRFLIAGGYEDVWFDVSLLAI